MRLWISLMGVQRLGRGTHVHIGLDVVLVCAGRASRSWDHGVIHHHAAASRPGPGRQRPAALRRCGSGARPVVSSADPRAAQAQQAGKSCRGRAPPKSLPVSTFSSKVSVLVCTWWFYVAGLGHPHHHRGAALAQAAIGLRHQGAAAHTFKGRRAAAGELAQRAHHVFGPAGVEHVGGAEAPCRAARRSRPPPPPWWRR